MKRTAFILIVLCRADTNRSSTFEAVPIAGLGWSKKDGQWIYQGIIDDCAMDSDYNAVITPREVSAYLQSRVDEANEDPNADKVYSIEVWAKDMEYPLFVMNP